jgi:4-diphosphocytidyl-2-C-methyl-D-erythritol kinase
VSAESRGGDRAVGATARAPAKINLVLEVLGRRADGFHELRSIFAPLALSDELRVRPLAPRRGSAGPVRDRLTVLGSDDVPVDGNLVLQATDLLRATAGRPLTPLAFRLRKRIPAAAGLGGGSSDALAALDLAAAAWGLRLGARRRLRLAATLGSDVPFFGLGGWALVGGRGERLRRLPPPAGGPLGVLIVVPAARLSTRDVFAAFDAAFNAAGGAPSGRAAGELAGLLRRGASVTEVAAVRPANDLLPAASALLPGLDRLRRELGDLLGRPVHLSGSGPALLVLYPSPRDARRAGTAVRAAALRRALRPPGGTLQVMSTATTGGEA